NLVLVEPESHGGHERRVALITKGIHAEEVAPFGDAGQRHTQVAPHDHRTVTKSLWLTSACTTCSRARLVFSGSFTSLSAPRSSASASTHTASSSFVGDVPNTNSNAAATNFASSASFSRACSASLIFAAAVCASLLFHSASACCGTMLSVRR